MKPVKTEATDLTYVGTSDEVGDLPCHRVELEGGRAIVSYWQPDKDELAALVLGAPVELAIYAEPIPPVSLAVHVDPALIDAAIEEMHGR